MAGPQIGDIDELEAYLEAWPAQLRCWQYGAHGRFVLVAGLDAVCHNSLEEAHRRLGRTAALGRQISAHHNALAIAAGWVMRHLQGRRPADRVDPHELEALLELAATYWGLRDAVIDVRAGVRNLQVEGEHIRLSYEGNLPIDLLDIHMARAELAKSLDLGATRSTRLLRWIATEGLTTPWPVVPDWVRAEFRAIASAELAVTKPILPPELAISGFTIREFDAYWVELLAWGLQISSAGAHGATDLPTRAPLVERCAFNRFMAERSGITERAATAITDRMTMNPERCPDGALTPLVPIDDDKLFPVSFLILSMSPQRNLLAALHADKNVHTGKLDRIIGDVGEARVMEILDRMSDVLVAHDIKLIGPDRSRKGQIDVSVCHPPSRTVAFFEVKWDLGADGSVEIYKSLQRVQEKRQQVIHHRRVLQQGEARLRRPPTWPDITGYTLRWFVLANNVLVTDEIDSDGVTIRSAQLLDQALPDRATMSDLLHLLDHTPVPAPDECTTSWHRMRYGDLELEIEVIDKPEAEPSRST